jgi:hypothetical protein
MVFGIRSVYYTVLSGLLMLFLSCGNATDSDTEGEGTVYDSLPPFEKDTCIYPKSIRSSSFMFPENVFGDVNVVDDDYSTVWKTLPGLITGEYVEFDFDSLFVESIYVHITKDLRFGKVKNLRVFADNTLLGTFPTEIKLPVNRKVNTIRVELGETDGINKVDFPMVQDSSRNLLLIKESFESVYTSKSVAVSEIEFFGAGGKKYPIRSIPEKKAKMNFYGVIRPSELHNQRLLFDGKPQFGWSGPGESKEKILLFSFEEDQVINGIYFPYTSDLNITRIGFRLRKRPLPEYEVKADGNKGLFIQLKNTLKGKNFELIILKTKPGVNPFIPELLFHDGSRYFGIISDSLEFYRNLRMDSARGTPLENYIDGRVSYSRTWEIFPKPLEEIFAKKGIKKDTVNRITEERKVVFRLSSNATFLIEETIRETKMDARGETRITTSERRAEGYWILKTKSAEEVQIVCHADLLNQRKTMTSEGEKPEEKNRGKMVFECTLTPAYIAFSKLFDGFKTTY